MSRNRVMVSASCFQMEERELSEPQKGEVMVQSRYISVDPYMRGRMNNGKSYILPFELSEPITGDATGMVLESGSEHFSRGDIVAGKWGWQERAIVTENELELIDTNLVAETAYLNVLGLTGLTAYFGLLRIGRPRQKETVVISGAAGSTGSIAGQIARIYGCRVVGITGRVEKAEFLTQEMGFHEAINYNKVPNIRKSLHGVCPGGIYVYFDNVGGDISDSVFYLINDFSRIVLCGQISLYNSGRIPTGPRMNSQLLIHRAVMQGFIVHDFRAHFEDARKQILKWMQEGKLRNAEHVIQGFDNTPEAFIGLFRGDNTGKQIIKI